MATLSVVAYKSVVGFIVAVSDSVVMSTLSCIQISCRLHGGHLR
jgi:hypothetical protein